MSGKMRFALKQVTIDPLDYATRAHEILEDAVRDLLSGNAVPWSGEGVLGTQAGLWATEEVIDTLRPLLNTTTIVQGYRAPRQRSSAVVDADLGQLQSELTSLAAAYGGQLPTNAQMTKAQSEALDAAIGQALEGLAQVPGMLETAISKPPGRIPRSVIRTDS